MLLLLAWLAARGEAVTAVPLVMIGTGVLLELGRLPAPPAGLPGDVATARIVRPGVHGAVEGAQPMEVGRATSPSCTDARANPTSAIPSGTAETRGAPRRRR